MQHGMKALLAHACEVWELTDSALRGNGRHHAISRPRQVLYWFASQMKQEAML